MYQLGTTAPRNTAGSLRTQQAKGQTPHRKEGTRAAADPKSFTQRRTMPCAQGEMLCLRQNRALQAPDGHVCQGKRGRRLHGSCGSGSQDNKTAPRLQHVRRQDWQAQKRHQLGVLGRDHLNYRRTRARGVRRVLVRVRTTTGSSRF